MTITRGSRRARRTASLPEKWPALDGHHQPRPARARRKDAHQPAGYKTGGPGSGRGSVNNLASSEYLQSFTFRLRGREKVFLDKIEKALRKIEDGTFGVCEECAEEISVKRLEARPETTLCIRCKEDQERMERDYS
jgi:RNA polymerase-binding transcription factor DksA